MLSHLVVANETAQAATGIPTIFTFSSATSIVAPFRPLFQAFYYSWPAFSPQKLVFYSLHDPPVSSIDLRTHRLTAQLTEG